MQVFIVQAGMSEEETNVIGVFESELEAKEIAKKAVVSFKYSFVHSCNLNVPYSLCQVADFLKEE